MKTPTHKELKAITRVFTIAAAEKNRADWWQILDLFDRQRALCVAGLQKKRAADPLASFSDAERARIKAAIALHVSRMELIARCFEASNTNVDGLLH